MAKTNYNYEKQARELAKERKKEEKRKKKLALNNDGTEEENMQISSDTSNTSKEA